MQVTPTNSLRPLGLGEVLDRAVTLCVKHALVFALIAVVLMVPLGLAQFFGFADQTKLFGALNDMARASSAGKSIPPEEMQQLFATSVFNGWTVLWGLLYAFGSPLMSGALIAGVAVAYLGGTLTFGGAYRAALRQWGHLLGLNLMFLILGAIVYVVVVVVAVVLILGIVAIGGASKGAALGLGIVVGLVFLLGLIGAALIGFLAWQLSVISCVVERQNFVAAFGLGLRRIFASVGLRRALVVGLAYFAISIGIAIVGGLGSAVLYGIVRSHILGQAFTVLVQLATAAFVSAFLTIFYFDLRVREEGFDLQLAAAAATANDALTTA